MSAIPLEPAPAAPAGEGRPWGRAALWLACLAPFFYATYGLANFLAGQRDDVPVFVFGWEAAIPFLPWTIIPYWTINAFYGLSLFVCATRAELDTHGRRLLTAQIVAVFFFIAAPLRFSFERGAPGDGLPGFLFEALMAFDRPFNQAPSLHIALAVILWVLYARHLPRVVHPILHVWFALICVSVLTTYQHHFIDMPTGALLGFFCLWLWPDRGEPPFRRFAFARSPQRWKLAKNYAAGALVCGILAGGIGGPALVLWWPCVALGIVALAYGLLGPGAFQKGADGRMSLAARVLLAPYILGARINAWAWTNGTPPAAEVVGGVWLGRLPRSAGSFATVVDLSAELPGGEPDRWRAVPCLDLVPPPPEALAQAVMAIEQARAQGPVLVCCALGFSRSAAAVAAWAVASGRASSVAQAVVHLRQIQPRLVLNPAALANAAEGARLAAPGTAA
ncbi:phosphatase PAP2/dual specificity phosphatase family protein [Zavarzinia sp. CC-PAN008]|uniref:phosphatase PAP2/dual specificity phosphatase family protein n=1 Tax=Zavarzinia sp. CC-PAN008 TaxID=3243332 RepID=UPI003F749A5F